MDLDMAVYRAMPANEKITTLAFWLEAAARTIERQGALIEAIQIDLEQQRHTDALAKIKAFYNGERTE